MMDNEVWKQHWKSIFPESGAVSYAEEEKRLIESRMSITPEKIDALYAHQAAMTRKLVDSYKGAGFDDAQALRFAEIALMGDGRR